jgi:hypothetical protein
VSKCAADAQSRGKLGTASGTLKVTVKSNRTRTGERQNSPVNERGATYSTDSERERSNAMHRLSQEGFEMSFHLFVAWMHAS